MLNLPAFINDKIMCSSHKVQTASTYCLDCKVFCCLSENCGHPHLYHSLENIDSFIHSTLIPALNILTEINQKRFQMFNSGETSLQSLIQNLTNTIENKKKQIEDHYQSIHISLQQLLSKCIKQFDIFLKEQTEKFNLLQKRMNNCFGTIDITDISNQMNSAANNAKRLDLFVQMIAPKIGEYSRTLKKAKETFKNEDFTNEIKELTTGADNDFDILKRTEEACSESFVSLIETQQKAFDKFHLMKETKTVPKRITFSFHVKAQSDLDLDLYVRELHSQFNTFRKEPGQVFQLLNNIAESKKSSDPKVGIVMNYIKNLALNYSLPLPQFEWDNDLSNCSEDYFKLTNNQIENDPNVFRGKVKDLLSGYFSNADYLNNLKSIAYSGVSEISQMILGLFLNENNWDNNKHCLFNEKFNIIGICAVPTDSGKIHMIINLGYFKAKE